MSDDRERRVRERAHAIWEAEGRAHGRDQEHWERATRELDADEPAAAPAVDGGAPETGVKRPRRKAASAATPEAPGAKPARAKSDAATLPSGVEPVTGYEAPAEKPKRRTKVKPKG